jgi:hypothetical protein
MHGRYLLIFGLATGLALSVVAPVVAQSVSTDVAPGANFSSYRTYTWVSTLPPAGLNPVMYQRIIADFDAALANKGYQKADSADLSLAITVGEQQKTDVESWGRLGLQTSVYQYTQGQLSLDVFDTKTKRALWHGQVSKTFNPDKPDPTAVDKSITKLMKGFPASGSTGTATPR